MTKERVPNFPFADFVTETFGTELRVGRREHASHRF